MAASEIKKSRGQFYTTNSEYILWNAPQPSSGINRIIEPFAGKGDLIEWIKTQSWATSLPIIGYDIEPKYDNIILQDTLRTPPNYENSWVITNPPYLARNKCGDKQIFDMYNTNDLYKCFIKSITGTNTCLGGIMLIPAGFFFSSRDLDTQCRSSFMQKYIVRKVHYFEESVFEDTNTTIVAVFFEKSAEKLTEQNVEWVRFPTKESRVFKMTENDGNQWIIGGEIYCLPDSNAIQIRRHVEELPLKEGEQQTYITLRALDSGKAGGEICLEYKPGYIYPAKDCSRTYATLRINGIPPLSEEEQKLLCAKFNSFLNEKREQYWSLFLPQYRESKEYARKRIPFELTYLIVRNIIEHQGVR